MALYVLDACALIALAENEEGADKLTNYLASDEDACLVHSLNFCEVYYQARRRTSADEASALINGLLGLGFVERADLDGAFWKAVGDLKSMHRKVSQADCCAVALANRLDTVLVTSVHHALDALADADVCKIEFFR